MNFLHLVFIFDLSKKEIFDLSKKEKIITWSPSCPVTTASRGESGDCTTESAGIVGLIGGVINWGGCESGCGDARDGQSDLLPVELNVDVEAPALMRTEVTEFF